MDHYNNEGKPDTAGRMARPLDNTADNEPEIFAPVFLGGNAAQNHAPAAPVAPVKDESPAPAPEKPRKAPRDEAGTRKPKKTKAEAEEGKEKFSIYLNKKVASALRMVYLNTRKKFNHTVEEALTDMFFNRYQCHNCCTRFSVSGSDNAPTCCPACGEKKFSQLRFDRLD